MRAGERKLTAKEIKEAKHRLLAQYNQTRKFGATRKVRKMAKNKRLRLLGKRKKGR